MNIKRILSFAVALIMAIALVPAAALAEEAAYEANEARGMQRWDNVWAVLDAVEAEMMAQGATRSEVTYAVYKAALNCPLIDKGSITDLNDNEFTFTTDGMLGGYNYRVRNFEKAPAKASVSKAASEIINRVHEVKNSPTGGAVDVLLVGPYYGSDSSFTDQYKNEALSIAAATGGTRTMLSGSQATGPNIASNYHDKAVVIYDSHGNCISSKQTSYLDLTSSSGLTTSDYSNGWAYNGGSFYGIDGRYIQNHASGTITNTFVWMAICEGMKVQGRGTTGTALLAAGCAAVYGYSQSVTFAGDYEYEATFWDHMKEGETVTEALEEMKSVHGIPDPYGDAYPILMSPVDPFPSNPDGAQETYCDWTLYYFEPTALESFSLSDEAISVYETYTKTVDFVRVPDNANIYELEWGTENASVATVAGNAKKVRITGVSAGSTRIYAIVRVDGEVFGTAYCDVTVNALPTLNEAANIAGGTLNFTSATANYPWRAGIVDDIPVAMSGNQGVGNSTSTMRLVLTMEAGETLSFRWMASAEEDFDYFRFFVNNTQKAQLTGETDWQNYTFTATSDGSYTFEWRFVKDPYVNGVTDSGYVDDVVYTPNAPQYILGDVDNDGVVTSVDAIMALRASMGIVTLTDAEIQRADVNGDGVIDSVDAILILRMSLRIA